MRKFCLVFALLCLGVAKANAVQTIAMTTNNQIVCTGQTSNSITLTSWSWGTTDIGISPSGTGGKVTLSQVMVSKAFDGCSPAMLKIYFGDGRLGTVLIEQKKTQGTTALPVAEVTLTNAVIAAYTVGGSSSNAASETWALSFDKVCVTTYGVTATGASQAGTTVCYE
jgi:type VI protein secretion system component Hcp